jgi:hypothetical protein
VRDDVFRRKITRVKNSRNVTIAVRSQKGVQVVRQPPAPWKEPIHENGIYIPASRLFRGPSPFAEACDLEGERMRVSDFVLRFHGLSFAHAMMRVENLNWEEVTCEYIRSACDRLWVLIGQATCNIGIWDQLLGVGGLRPIHWVCDEMAKDARHHYVKFCRLFRFFEHVVLTMRQVGASLEHFNHENFAQDYLLSPLMVVLFQPLTLMNPIVWGCVGVRKDPSGDGLTPSLTYAFPDCYGGSFVQCCAGFTDRGLSLVDCLSSTSDPIGSIVFVYVCAQGVMTSKDALECVQRNWDLFMRGVVQLTGEYLGAVWYAGVDEHDYPHVWGVVERPLLVPIRTLRADTRASARKIVQCVDERVGLSLVGRHALDIVVRYLRLRANACKGKGLKLNWDRGCCQAFTFAEGLVVSDVDLMRQLKHVIFSRFFRELAYGGAFAHTDVDVDCVVIWEKVARWAQQMLDVCGKDSSRVKSEELLSERRRVMEGAQFMFHMIKCREIIAVESSNWIDVDSRVKLFPGVRFVSATEATQILQRLPFPRSLTDVMRIMDELLHEAGFKPRVSCPSQMWDDWRKDIGMPDLFEPGMGFSYVVGQLELPL